MNENTPNPSPSTPPGAGDGPRIAGTNCAGETAAQVANYILAALRVLFKGNQSGQSLCDAIGSAIVGALKESSAAGAASRQPEIDGLRERVKSLEEERDDLREALDMARDADDDCRDAEVNALAARVKVLEETCKNWGVVPALNPPAASETGGAGGEAPCVRG